MIVIWILQVIALNQVVGIIVLSELDRDGSLFRWCGECPLGSWLPVMLWPVTVWALVHYANRNEAAS